MEDTWLLPWSQQAQNITPKHGIIKINYIHHEKQPMRNDLIVKKQVIVKLTIIRHRCYADQKNNYFSYK